MVEQVIARLNYLGYMVDDSDQFGIQISVSNVLLHICNYCNLTELPASLVDVAVDMACGEFLAVQKQLGNLDDKLNLSVAIKACRLGDVDVTYTSEAGGNDINSLIGYLKKGREGDLVCYRKMKW